MSLELDRVLHLARNNNVYRFALLRADLLALLKAKDFTTWGRTEVINEHEIDTDFINDFLSDEEV